MSSYPTPAPHNLESPSKNPKTERDIIPTVESATDAAVNEQVIEAEDKCEHLPFVKPPKPEVGSLDRIIEKDGLYFIIKLTNS